MLQQYFRNARVWVTDFLRQRLRLSTSMEFGGAAIRRLQYEGARHGTSIAASRPAASSDRVERSSDPILLVNFRAGNNSGCLEINQYREMAGAPGRRELASRCTTNRFVAQFAASSGVWYGVCYPGREGMWCQQFDRRIAGSGLLTSAK